MLPRQVREMGFVKSPQLAMTVLRFLLIALSCILTQALISPGRHASLGAFRIECCQQIMIAEAQMVRFQAVSALSAPIDSLQGSLTISSPSCSRRIFVTAGMLLGGFRG
jgi:hypothetical protein